MMEYLWSFIVGGILCAIGQVLMDATTLTTPRVLVIFVVTGVVLESIGLYQAIVDLAGNGATVPLTGFGYNLAKGVKTAIQTDGFLGILTGGLKATAGGITAAVIAGLLASLIFRPKDKS